MTTAKHVQNMPQDSSHARSSSMLSAEMRTPPKAIHRIHDGSNVIVMTPNIRPESGYVNRGILR